MSYLKGVLNNMKKFISVSLALILALMMQVPVFSYGAESSGLPFKDVAPGAWYEAAVSYSYSKGIIAGTSSTSFSPEAELTRAQLISILWRKAGKPVVNYALAYSDVDWLC